MKKTLTLLLVIVFSQLSFSQQKEIDSLIAYFSTIKNDSLKTLEVGKSLKYYYTKDKLDVFRLVIEDDLKRLELLEDKKSIVERLNFFARYYKKRGELDSALLKYKQSIKICEELKDLGNANRMKISVANILKFKGDYENATLLFNEALQFFEKDSLKYIKEIPITQLNLGSLFTRMKEWEKADNINELVFQNPIVTSNKKMYSSICINLVASKTKLKKFNEALNYAKLAEKIETRPKSLANLYNNIGNIYSEQFILKKAEEYYLKSLEKYKEIDNESGILKSYNNLGNNYRKLGKLDKAEMYLLKAHNILLKKGDPSSLFHNYDMLRDLYRKKGNYKYALDYYHEGQKLKDSILGLEKQKAIADIEIKYETEKTQREKEAAEKQVEITQLESDKNRNLFLGTLAIVALGALTSLFYFGRLKAKKKIELVTLELKETQKRLAIEKQYRNSELKALKSQMNPHFIFNALNSIQDYIVLNQKNLASDYLGKFADLIRNYLHFSNTGFITIPEEVHNLNLYLELEKLRFEEELTYIFNVDSNANSDTIKIPTMLIQPYIENALKHGLLHKKTERTLYISILKESDKIIECIIEDNGIGREKSKEINAKRQAEHKSFALKATTERLDLLNYGREKKIGVEIIDLKENNQPKGTKVILKIPVLE